MSDGFFLSGPWWYIRFIFRACFPRIVTFRTKSLALLGLSNQIPTFS